MKELKNFRINLRSLLFLKKFKNDSEKINLETYLNGLKYIYEKKKNCVQKFSDFFQLIDVDNSGFISYEEIILYFNNDKKDLSNNEILKLNVFIDLINSENKEISRDDFFKIMFNS